MRRHIVRLASASTLIAILSGCASIVSDNKEIVSINSSPQEAEIIITDENHNEIYRGKTPTTVTLNTSDGYFDGQEYTISFRKDGYEAHTLTVGSRINGWYVGNIVFGGFIGLLVVDPLTGAMWALESDDVDIALRTNVAQQEAPASGLEIVTLSDVPESARSRMVQVN